MATLLCYGALLSYAIALPTSSSSGNSPSSVDNFTASHAMASDSLAFDTNYRSTFEIVWSCLTVVFASSWLCVHPNVTGYNTSMWQRLRERLKLFLLALFAPEVLAVFAFYQWRGCQKLYQSFKEKADELQIDIQLSPWDSESIGCVAASQRLWKRIPRRTFESIKTVARAVLSYGTDPKEATWSYTHAHFVQMGGIVFKDGAGRTGFKRPEDWDDEDLRGFFAMKLSEAAISDKSKAGALAKTLVAARVVWFLVQTVARAVQGLPIALLEVASLAFISFHLAMYVFWWHKPLDVENPVQMAGIPGPGKTEFEVKFSLVMFSLMGYLDAVPIGMWTYSSKRQLTADLQNFTLTLDDPCSSLSSFISYISSSFQRVGAGL